MGNDKLEIARNAWVKSPDEHVFQAADSINDYDPEIRQIILDEVEKRKQLQPMKDRQHKEEDISNYNTLVY